ncbi:hypothetical protein AVEN_4154-1 [Araneus ventricosus]|uniref:DUF4817 domain-containing protein n=1 Tax=Araneus ventricosus TaxID=182803 RepID=A0A4Y2M2V2_ARAVE|nr:hypothetical protein AVEN_4154-1 [Araneus ventricosus]
MKITSKKFFEKLPQIPNELLQLPPYDPAVPSSRKKPRVMLDYTYENFPTIKRRRDVNTVDTNLEPRENPKPLRTHFPAPNSYEADGKAYDAEAGLSPFNHPVCFKEGRSIDHALEQVEKKQWAKETHCDHFHRHSKNHDTTSTRMRSHWIRQYVIKRFKEENRIENKVREGRLAKLTERDQRFIIRKFVKNPRLSALKVSAEFNEKFSTPQFHLKLFDEFSEQLD